MVDFGKLLLRLTVGGLLLPHGIHKIQHGFEGVTNMVKAQGLPEQLAWGVFVGEVAAPALLILGIFPRLAALAIVANMGMALYLAHQDQLTTINPLGGGWSVELPAFYLLAALSIVFLGGGRMSLMRGSGDAGTGSLSA
jgi:putative oxidoreductase